MIHTEKTVRAWFDRLYKQKQLKSMRKIEAYTVYLDYLEVKADKKLLDVGCGPGLLLKTAQAKGLQTFGIDLSQQAISLASQTSPDSQLQVGSVTQIPYPDNNFDYITCIGVLEHFLEMDKSVAELKRIAKDDARYCIMVPNSRTLYWKISERLSRTHRESNENARSLEEWQDFFSHYEFKIQEVHRDDWQIRKFFIILGLGAFPQLTEFAKKILWKIIPLTFAHQFIFILEKKDHV
jgi:ubiquinone/menaquinone biosynthesis C-methylase UbiE